MRKRGNTRTAIVLLRKACALDTWRARTYTLLGALLTTEGHHEEARQALTHAHWLRNRSGEDGRKRTTARLLEQVGR